MNPADDIDYGAVRRAAEGYLARWSDGATTRLRDDLAQEATIVTWRKRSLLRDPDRAAAFARTVARRLRSRALRRLAAVPMRGLEVCTDADLTAWDRRSDDDGWFEVAERRVGDDRMLVWLDRSLDRLTRSNADLLRDFYAGSSCRELADRMGLDSRAVKARLHRGRRRLRKLLEWRAASASYERVGSVSPAGSTTCPHESNRAER